VKEDNRAWSRTAFANVDRNREDLSEQDGQPSREVESVVVSEGRLRD
jgi:hypothetical protein